ncbi:CBS domain-containing protein [Thalassotalea sp. LPB0316]|uniref:CBS domain-containing protein n=1 Tax=Thalassotalea sp. LPB0316 TaxID=2769490 RepID=UPI001866D894|nr:CBS domain-containing protein [Thalassotalea sp. LPB0316]QOL27029.1 CBS domain-containing protein [Thalassotalea sp. LPB0316]
MNLTKYISTKLVYLTLDSTLRDAKTLFDRHNIHHLIVLDEEEKLVGILTDRDLYKQLGPTIGSAKQTREDERILAKKIHLVMTRNPVSCLPNTSLGEMAVLFHDNHISALPIVNADHKALGIITWRDILKMLAIRYQEKQLGIS